LVEQKQKREHKYLLFELTKACHNNCVFCYNVWKEDNDYPQHELSTKDVIALLEKLFKRSSCQHIALTGGEPLLKDGIFEIAAFMASNNVMPILITNGKLLTESTARKCIQNGIKYFEVSLHSDKREIHDELVGRGGSFEEVIDAIMNTKRLGGHLNTVFVATKKNIHTFKGFVELNALLRVEWILFNRVACGGSCMADWQSLAPSPAQVQQALEEGASVAEKYRIGLSAGVQVQPCLIDLSKCKNVRTGFCPLNDPVSEDSYFAIDPAGNLRMCNRSKTILGNLLERSFDDIVQSREVEEFGRAIPDFCLDCRLAKACAGGCKADAVSYFGTLAKSDPYLEMWKEQARKIREHDLDTRLTVR
jgi:radical SAM protein with 4Fe4S-binding SPASM domain